MELSELARERRLNEIGLALSKELDLDRLLELIVVNACELTAADGGTLYRITPDKMLKFEILRNHSLHYAMGGKTGQCIPFESIPLWNENKEPNYSFTVTYAVHHKETVRIADVYQEPDFDFRNTRYFDQQTGYRTRAVLVVPIMNHEGDVIAVLQLINPTHGGEFSLEDQQVAESLASQAGIAINNQILITSLKSLFESLIRILAEAIDKISPATGNHSARVPEIAAILARAVNRSGLGSLTEAEIYELQVAALLHDCGKLTTPHYILEKQKKLEGRVNGQEIVDLKLQLYATRAEVSLLQGQLTDTEYQHIIQNVTDWKARVTRVNSGAYLEEDQRAFDQMHQLGLLSDIEWEQLSIKEGNLTAEERKLMQGHVSMTIDMLSKLQYPKDLQRVPEIAGQHHEKIDGSGYPRGLKGNQLSLQSKILAMSDVFEALSAPDRSYKSPYPLSQILSIMQVMVAKGHLDPSLYQVFLSQKVYLDYAKHFLSPNQIDCS